jgi:hypothetical protein
MSRDNPSLWMAAAVTVANEVLELVGLTNFTMFWQN